MAREQATKSRACCPLCIQIFVLKIVGCIDGQYDHWSCTLIINIMNFFLCLGLHEKKTLQYIECQMITYCLLMISIIHPNLHDINDQFLFRF